MAKKLAVKFLSPTVLSFGIFAIEKLKIFEGGKIRTADLWTQKQWVCQQCHNPWNSLKFLGSSELVFCSRPKMPKLAIHSFGCILNYSAKNLMHNFGIKIWCTRNLRLTSSCKLAASYFEDAKILKIGLGRGNIAAGLVLARGVAQVFKIVIINSLIFIWQIWAILSCSAHAEAVAVDSSPARLINELLLSVVRYYFNNIW